MAFIKTIPPAQARGEVRKLYRQQQGDLDYLPNYAAVFCHRPQVMMAWAELQDTLRLHLDSKSYSLITLAAALAIKSSYCSLAHARKLMRRHYSTLQMVAIVQGNDDSPLTPAQRCMMRVARRVALDSSAVTQTDIQSLRDHGFSDAQVFDIVAAAAARCFFAKIPDALGAHPDALLGGLDENLERLLSVGRPVSAQKT